MLLLQRVANAAGIYSDKVINIATLSEYMHCNFASVVDTFGLSSLLILGVAQESIMFKLRETSIIKLVSSPQNIALLAAVAVLMAFIGNKMWQEYQIYKMNEMIQSYPTASGGTSDLVITWEDYANNEDGYQVERRTESGSEYDIVGVIAANSTSYTDASELEEAEYCYRVGAFNRSGMSYSDDACIAVSPSATDPEQATKVIIASEFGGRPGKVELDGKEFYSFKSNYPYNEEFTIDEVSNLEFNINKGLLRFKDSKAFLFREQGEQLDNGFARMKFNDKNSFSFTLQGNGQAQVATLYLSLGAWGESEEEPALTVIAGETTHLLTLPARDTWFYATINISFDDLTQVNITPVGRYRKGGVKVAGVVLNKPNQSAW